MSQASIAKFSSFMEGTVLATLETHSQGRHRTDLNKQDMFMDLSNKNLILSNPTTFGSSHLDQEEKRSLIDLFRVYLSEELKAKGGKEYDHRTILGNPKKYTLLTRGPGTAGKNIVYILLTRNKKLIGVVAAAPIGGTNDVFKTFRNSITAAANKLDQEILARDYNQEVRSVNPNAATATGYKSVLDIGHIGLGDAAGRTPLLDKMMEARSLGSAAPAANPSQMSVAHEVDRMIQRAQEDINRAHASYFQHTALTRNINQLALEGGLQIYYTGVQGAKVNQNLLGLQVEKKVSDKLKKDVSAYLKKQGGLANMEGSPSFMALLKLSAINLFKKGIGIKQSHVTSDKRPINPITGQRKAQKKATDVPPTGAKFKNLDRDEDGMSSLKLQNLINIYLHNAIKRNMITPRLVYRTGRFAKSVKVARTYTTQKGFKVFKYTYMENPYSTFEVGNKMGTPDRDPRPLIEMSIRDVARRLVGGRFRSEPL